MVGGPDCDHAVTFVVVPFGYASARTDTYTGLHTDVLIAAGLGLAMGVGVGLRSGTLSAWTGILIGSMVGITATLITGTWTGAEWVLLVPPVLALAVGLIDGLSRSALRSYRDVNRETFIVAILLSLGLFFALVAQIYLPGGVSWDLLLNRAGVAPPVHALDRADCRYPQPPS